MNDCGDSSSCSSIVLVHSRVFGKRLSSRNKVEYFRSNISISVNIQSRDYLEGTDVIRLCLLEASWLNEMLVTANVGDNVESVNLNFDILLWIFTKNFIVDSSNILNFSLFDIFLREIKHFEFYNRFLPFQNIFLREREPVRKCVTFIFFTVKSNPSENVLITFSPQYVGCVREY